MCSKIHEKKSLFTQLFIFQWLHNQDISQLHVKAFCRERILHKFKVGSFSFVFFHHSTTCNLYQIASMVDVFYGIYFCVCSVHIMHLYIGLLFTLLNLRNISLGLPHTHQLPALRNILSSCSFPYIIWEKIILFQNAKPALFLNLTVTNPDMPDDRCGIVHYVVPDPMV